MYEENIIYTNTTPYQRIVLTHNKSDYRLYLNKNLQFSSADEYRYHEALIHPALQALPQAKDILILGGGDGLAVREILKYPQVQSVDMVDLDPAMTHLFRTNPMLVQLNEHSLLSAKVHIANTDAYRWIRQDTMQYDMIIADFPDPSNYSIGKLYSNAFYKEMYRVLRPGGIAVIQSTSPYIARKSFWCIAHTLADAGFHTIPYHAYVPSFGEWGYTMALKNESWRGDGLLPKGLKYISTATIKDMLYFPPDMAEEPTEINKLNNQVLVHYFEDDWAPYIH